MRIYQDNNPSLSKSLDLALLNVEKVPKKLRLHQHLFIKLCDGAIQSTWLALEIIDRIYGRGI